MIHLVIVFRLIIIIVVFTTAPKPGVRVNVDECSYVLAARVLALAVLAVAMTVFLA